MFDFFEAHQTAFPWVVFLIFSVWILALFLIKRSVFRGLRTLAKTTHSYVHDIFIASADMPLNLLIVASGGWIVERIVVRPGNEPLYSNFHMAFKAVTIVAVVLFVDRFIRAILHLYSDRTEVMKSAGGIVRGVVRGIVFSFGLLILLDTFGISITPIIASLGIGSLAVALALQSTLENVFAGVQILVDKPIVVGQFIKLDSGEEGYVHKIGWRSVWVRLLANNVVVIPNKIMVNTKFLNYYYPVTEMSTLVQVGVHYKSDLEHVEKVTLEVARETLKEVDGGTKTFNPFMRYHTLGEYSINFTVILRVDEFVDNYFIKHEFIKRLHRRYNKEGIIIPYPIRAANHSQEQHFESLV